MSFVALLALTVLVSIWTDVSWKILFAVALLASFIGYLEGLAVIINEKNRRR